MSFSENLCSHAEGVEQTRSSAVPSTTLARKAKRSLMARMRRFQSSDTTGSALVEMALSLPILFLVMTGIFSFSIALYQKLELAEAISAGGRALAAARNQPDPCGLAWTAISNAAPTLNPNNITLTFVLNGVTTSGKSCSVSGGNPNMILGGTAKVTGTYPCVINAFKYSFGSCTLSTSLTENVQ